MWLISSQIMTRRPASKYGNGRIRTASTALKMAVFAPMPSANVSTATAVKPGFFSSWRKANFRSFITQCLHRIDFRCAAGGQPAGEQCNAGEQKRNGGERQRIGGFHFKKQALHHTCQRPGAGDAEQNPDAHHTHPLSDDERKDIAFLRAERHAQSDLMRALRDGVSDDAVDA